MDTNEAGIPAELVDHPRYRIVKELGSGGMGVVYQAEHRLMERQVALKVINSRLVNSDEAVERFRLEVKAAAKLSHRNIVAAYDAEQAGDLHFLVMEFVEGMSLSELVKRRGTLSVLHACNYAMQAAQGLQHAFEEGMVHRDIKPHNLMRTVKGTIKILDFGLARFASQQHAQDDDAGLTGAGVTLGTPDYIAPEQARDSRRADIRADIYGLGCTLYSLLAGQAPFPNGTAIEKVVAHCKNDPTPLTQLRSDIPDEVVGIVERMMAKDPADRFQTPAEIAEALKPFGRPSTSGSSPVTSETTVSTSTRDASLRNTQVAAGATFAPLEPTDLLKIPQEELQVPPLPSPPLTRAQPPSAWRQLLRKHRLPLFGGAAAFSLLLIAWVVVPPVLRSRTGEADSSNGPNSIAASGGESNSSGELRAVDGWIDLMASIDTSRHQVAGQWRKSNGRLTVASGENARLVLPYKPPAEYDFEVTFTRDTGANSIALHFVAGDGQATFDIDGWNQNLAGIQNIDGQSMQENSTRVEGQRLVNGQTYTATVRVRRGQVDVFLDGRRLATYHGDGANLSMLELWQLPDSRALGLGAYQSAATFHRIRVRPVQVEVAP